MVFGFGDLFFSGKAILGTVGFVTKRDQRIKGETYLTRETEGLAWSPETLLYREASRCASKNGNNTPDCFGVKA